MLPRDFVLSQPAKREAAFLYFFSLRLVVWNFYDVTFPPRSDCNDENSTGRVFFKGVKIVQGWLR